MCDAFTGRSPGTDYCRAQKLECVMSLFVKLMITGWTTALVMFGFFALRESGKLAKIGKRIVLRLETSTRPIRTREETMQ